MENKILIAIDLSENSLKAVEYVGAMASCCSAVRITLLHIIKEPSPDIMPDENHRRSYVERVRSEVLGLMEQAAQRLKSHGIAENHIQLKIQICKRPVSVSELILHEQKSGAYGTVVVGRRGVSKREEFLFGSVSNSVMREAKHCTVWVVE